MKPLEIDRNEFIHWNPTSDDREKIIQLTQVLVSAIGKVDEKLSVLAKNISLQKLTYTTLLSLRNIHNALSYLKGKKQKAKFGRTKKLSVRFDSPVHLRAENENLVSKLTEESQQRRKLETELHQTRKELEELQKTIEESKTRLNLIGQNKSSLHDKVDQTDDIDESPLSSTSPKRIRSKSFDVPLTFLES